MKRIIPLFVTALAFVLTFGATAHAAAAVEPTNGSLLDLMSPIWEAFAHGHYVFAGATCLVLAVALARRYAEPRWGWLGTNAGSATLALLGSLGATLSATLADGSPATWPMVWGALKIAFVAMGGYSAIRALIIVPYVEKFADKGPAWLHTPAQLILWIFQVQPPASAAT